MSKLLENDAKDYTGKADAFANDDSAGHANAPVPPDRGGLFVITLSFGRLCIVVGDEYRSNAEDQA